MTSIINSHNSKILPKDGAHVESNKSCNCRNKDLRPLDGACLVSNVVYKATVATTPGEKNSGLNGIRIHDLCDTGAALYQLSHQANWELVIQAMFTGDRSQMDPTLSWNGPFLFTRYRSAYQRLSTRDRSVFVRY